MNDYEKDLAIYRMMAKEADALIQKAACPAGEFSAAKVNVKNGFYLPLDEEVVTFSSGSFTCSCRRDSIFYYLAKYEKYIQPKDRVKFSKREDKGEKLLTVVKPKEFAFLKKATMRDANYPLMHGVMLEAKTMTMFASDGHILTAAKCQGHEVLGEFPADAKFILPPEILGCKESKITISMKEGKTFATCGSVTAELTAGRYPNVYGVIGGFMSEIRFSSWKDFQKSVKAVALTSEEKEPIVILSAEAGSKELRLSEKEGASERVVKLLEPAQSSMRLALRAKYVTKSVVKSDRLLFNGCDRAVVFVGKDEFSLIMPVYLSDGIATGNAKLGRDLINPCQLIGMQDVDLTPKVEETEDIPEVPAIEEKEEKHLPAVIVRPAILPIGNFIPKENVRITLPERKVLALPAPATETANEVDAVDAIEVRTVNGMTEGDFVKLHLPTGYSLVCKVIRFSEDGCKVCLNVKGWNKWTFHVSMIEPTDERKNTLPEWLTGGQTVTDGVFTGEICKVERSKVFFADGGTKPLKQVLLNCYPTAKVVVTPTEPEKKENIFMRWAKNILRYASMFSF